MQKATIKINVRGFQFVLLFLLLCIVSCKNKDNTDTANAEYIRNLEEKNRRLEQELQNKNTYTPSGDQGYSQYESNYFTIGSTEEDVVKIMGDPSSVTKFEMINEKLLVYGRSTITFKNGRVKEYSNYGNNLRVKYMPGADKAGTTNEHERTQQPQKSETKYIYFSCLIEQYRELQSYYSKIYTVTNFTEDKALEIKNCLIEQLKFFTHTEERIGLIQNSFSSLSEASSKWNNETGKKIFGDGSCNLPSYN